MNNRIFLRPTRLHRASRNRTVEPMKPPARTASRHRLRLTAAAVAIVLAATACAGTDPAEDPPEPTDAAPPLTTETPAPATTAPEVGPAAPAEGSPDGTDVAAPDTTEAPPAGPPEIVIWSTPRMFAGTLSGSWQVTPEDSSCSFDFLNEAGDVVGTGFSTTADGDPSGRGMIHDFGDDLASAAAIRTVVIRCSLLGGEETTVEHSVHRVTYQNRHPDSVIPADDDHYFDHDEVKALFPECRPPRFSARPPTRLGQPSHVIDKVVDQGTSGFVDFNDWLEMSLNFWDEVFEGWDTETHEVGGRHIASGWWTTGQLRMMFPNSTITAEAARNEASYNSKGGLVWPIALNRQVEELYVNIDWNVFPSKGDGYYYLQHLYLRLKDAVGYVSEVDGATPTRGTRGQWVRDNGIAGNGPNPGGVREENLLWDWMDSRYSFPPVDREPTAWAMRTLLNSRSSDCVAPSMREHCESGEFHPSRHMRHPSQGGSRLGSALWSIVCPEIAP